MSFFQRILGQKYKWLYVLKYNFAITNSGIRANLLSNIPLVLNSLAVIFVWSKANPTIAIFYLFNYRQDLQIIRRERSRNWNCARHY